MRSTPRSQLTLRSKAFSMLHSASACSNISRARLRMSCAGRGMGQKLTAKRSRCNLRRNVQFVCEPLLDRGAHLGEMPLEEMVRVLHDHESLRLGCIRHHTFQVRARRVLIASTADEQFRRGTVRQKAILVIPTVSTHGRSQPDQCLHSLVIARGAQAYSSAERESRSD